MMYIILFILTATPRIREPAPDPMVSDLVKQMENFTKPQIPSALYKPKEFRFKVGSEIIHVHEIKGGIRHVEDRLSTEGWALKVWRFFYTVEIVVKVPVMPCGRCASFTQ